MSWKLNVDVECLAQNVNASESAEYINAAAIDDLELLLTSETADGLHTGSIAGDSCTYENADTNERQVGECAVEMLVFQATSMMVHFKNFNCSYLWVYILINDPILFMEGWAKYALWPDAAKLHQNIQLAHHSIQTYTASGLWMANGANVVCFLVLKQVSDNFDGFPQVK